MSSNLPTRTAKAAILSHITALENDPYFDKKVGSLDDGNNRNMNIGAQAILYMHQQGVLQQFTDWATHERSGVIYQQPQIHPVPEKLKEVLEPFTGEINKLLKKKDENNEPRIPRRTAMQKIVLDTAYNVAENTVLASTAAVIIKASRERDPNKKMKAAMKGLAAGVTFGVASGAIGLALRQELGYYTSANISVTEPGAKSELDINDILKYSCKALDKLHTKTQNAGVMP